MGSGHFLVSAVDRIESAMRNFLVENPVPGVSRELQRLEVAAKEALGDDYQFAGDIDKAGLLRRQIARRCIYGLDINPLAVELSRLALWIHTFVPGLPMSSLDHGLVCANSLTGIGTINEALEALEPNSTGGQISIFESAISDALDKAKNLLVDAANADEANKQEVKDAAKIAKQARKAAESTKHLFDAAVAARLGEINAANFVDPDSVRDMGSSDKVQDLVSPLNPAHMPYLFPEVFLRENPGFDVLLGNPPWEELVFDEPRFWSKLRPGLMGEKVQARDRIISELKIARPDLVVEAAQRKQNVDSARQILVSAFELGAGDTDLYKAFAWRWWQLLRENGSMGIVLPKTAFSAVGLSKWRREILTNGTISSVTFIANSGRWAFDMEPRYSIAIASIEKSGSSDVKVAGLFASQEEFMRGSLKPVEISRETLLSLTHAASIPMLATQCDAEILTQIRKSSRLDTWDNANIRLVREFDATNDRKWFDALEGEGDISVYSGATFNIWVPDTSEYFAKANENTARGELLRKLQKQLKLKSSAFYGLDWKSDFNETLPYERARIAFRGVTFPTNSRTCIAALVPPRVILTNIAPYIFMPFGNESRESFLLGIMNSLPFDWYARRFIETQMNFHFVNAFPIPSFNESGSLVCARVMEISGRLSAIDSRYTEWAKEVGVPVGSVTDESTKDDLIAELDALVALLYGLDESQVTHIFETFHRGWDYKPRLEAVLKHFNTWKDKK